MTTFSTLQKLFVYGFYQLQNIAFICSVYQTIVLAFHRYLAISRPIEYYVDNSVAAMSSKLEKILLYNQDTLVLKLEQHLVRNSKLL